MIPTQPGYYWRRGPNHDEEIVDQIVKVEPMVSTAPNELFYWEMGDMGGIYIKEEEGVQWLGPLPSMDEQVELHTEYLDIAQALNDGKIPWHQTMAGAVRQLVEINERYKQLFTDSVNKAITGRE